MMKFPSWPGKGTPLQWHCWLGEKEERKYFDQASQFCPISLLPQLMKADESPPIERHLLTAVTPAWLLGNVNPLLNTRGRKVCYKSNQQFCKLIFILQADEQQQIWVLVYYVAYFSLWLGYVVCTIPFLTLDTAAAKAGFWTGLPWEQCVLWSG